MSQMRFAYSKTPILKSTPKDQRSIIADILLAADRPLSFVEIVAEARKARYEETFKGGTIESQLSSQSNIISMRWSNIEP
jgi:hypothetical protein